MEWGHSYRQTAHVPGEDPPKAIKGPWGLLPSFVSLVALVELLAVLSPVEILAVLSPVWASVSGKKKGAFQIGFYYYLYR